MTFMLILSGFNIESMSEDACDDLEGLDASATHVANLLISEPDDGMKANITLNNPDISHLNYNILLSKIFSSCYNFMLKFNLILLVNNDQVLNTIIFCRYETRDIKAKHDTYETYNILLEWNLEF